MIESTTPRNHKYFAPYRDAVAELKAIMTHAHVSKRHGSVQPAAEWQALDCLDIIVNSHWQGWHEVRFISHSKGQKFSACTCGLILNESAITAETGFSESMLQTGHWDQESGKLAQVYLMGGSVICAGCGFIETESEYFGDCYHENHFSGDVCDDNCLDRAAQRVSLLSDLALTHSDCGLENETWIQRKRMRDESELTILGSAVSLLLHQE